ncbi:MAG: hypothetical protein FJ263_00215 [Planctomycetes bacterium]|nr:hypothetical protein [Planctomycetota bacterium]
MKLPTIQNAKRYTGLYVVDFGDHSAVGFTSPEVAELLESELFADVKVYKIHNAYPDGRMELKGMRNETFQLEAGMLFYAADEQTARDDFKRLTNIAVASAPPARAKVHLAKLSESEFVTAMIYPAEHDDDFSRWLLDNHYRTAGQAEGGAGAVEQYYTTQKEILDQQQLWAADSFDQLTGAELIAATRKTVVR